MGIHSEKATKLLELIVVIFLGVASVFGAFSAYQSALNGSAMSKEYNEGISTITDANSSYVEAGQVISNDMVLYQSMVSLQLDVEYAQDEVERVKAQEKLTNFEAKFLTLNLQNAIEWATAQETSTGYYTSPFESEVYLDAVYKTANATYQEGRVRLELGHVYNTNGDKMGLIVIYYALILFLLGISSSIKRNELKLALLAFSLAIFIFATVQMLGIPFLTP